MCTVASLNGDDASPLTAAKTSAAKRWEGDGEVILDAECARAADILPGGRDGGGRVLYVLDE